MTRNSGHRHTLLIRGVVWGSVLASLALVAFALVLVPAADVSGQVVAAPAALPADVSKPVAATMAHTVTLPLVVVSDRLWTDAPIWLDALPPGEPEVALFRRTFSVDRAIDAAALTLLADTRYEVWFDGAWLGRGPARFSRHLAEYDVYDLGTLAAGSHVLAVMVQWAPNIRRAESLTPFLAGHVTGQQDGEVRLVARTGPEWRVSAPEAWRRDAPQVREGNLIGPAELLDFRTLPADWMKPGFDDTGWTQAVVKSWSLAPTRFRPRTIPFSTEVAIPLEVVDAGQLSPGRAIAELVPPLPDPYSLPLQVDAQTTLTVEALAGVAGVPPFEMLVDDRPAVWRAVGEARPDVLAAVVELSPGLHWITVAGVPGDGATISLSTYGLDSRVPFGQGINAGRRLLLSEPVSQPDQVMVSAGEGLTVELCAPASYLVVDLGRVVHGRLVAQVSGPAGSVVDAGWSQRLWLEGRPLPYPGSLDPRWNQVDSWVLDGTERTLTTIDARAGRYLLLAGWNLDEDGGPIRLEKLYVMEERYPAAERGWFASDDPFLDLAWQIGVDTLYPNMVDAYTDTPWRERGQWWGDAFVEDRINQVAIGDSALLARGLTFMALAFASGRPDALAPSGDSSHMLDFGMLWVQALWGYWERTGDEGYLESNYAALRALMGFLSSHTNETSGLLDLPRAHWSETALIDWFGYDSRFGQSAALNAMYYGTLGDAAAIATVVGDELQAAVWSAEADRVRDAANTSLFLTGEGRYVTTLYAGETVPPSPHAQAWPLAYGLVPEVERDRVADALMDLLSADPSAPNVDIYGMYWVLEGLARAERVEEALAVVRTYYGHLVSLGATTWWETFLSYERYDASLCHAWGGAPTWFLTTHVLGARQVAPCRWLVRPALAGVRQASGAIPLCEGDLEVTWRRPSCEEATLHLVVPAGTEGKVVLPLEPGATLISLNGVAIWDHGQPLVPGVSGVGGAIHVMLDDGGMYLFEAQHDCGE